MTWLIETIGAAAGVLAVTGCILNNRRMRACFYLWMVSNGLSAGLHVHAGLWSLVVRDVVFTVLAIEGAWRWRRTRERSSP